MTDGRTISSANAFRNWRLRRVRPSLGLEQMEASPSPSSSRFAEEEEIGERIDPARSLADFDGDEEIK